MQAQPAADGRVRPVPVADREVDERRDGMTAGPAAAGTVGDDLKRPTPEPRGVQEAGEHPPQAVADGAAPLRIVEGEAPSTDEGR